MTYRKIEFDVDLPPLSVWAIDDDAVCMDMGDTTHYDLTDSQAILGLQRLKWKLRARMDALDRELERLVERNRPTEHGVDDNKAAIARADRWFREQYPRELEIALAEAGIEVNK